MAKTGPSGFQVYKETAVVLSMLPPEEAGKLIIAVSNYFLTGERQFSDGRMGIIAEQMMDGVDRGRRLWEKQVAGGKSRAGDMWGDRTPTGHLQDTYSNQTKPNQNQNYISISNQPPTIEEVEEYAKEIGSGVDTGAFFRKYERSGWTVEGEPIRDWKAVFDAWDKKTPKPPAPRDETITMEQVKRLREKIRGGTDGESVTT